MTFTGSRFTAIDDALTPLIGQGADLPPVGWTGPTTWWAGPLDVEGLCSAALRLALTAASVLATERGRPIGFATSADRVAANVGSLQHLVIDGRAPDLWAPMSEWFKTADGWIRLHGNYPHHSTALSRVLGVRDRHELERVLRHLHSHETEARVRAGGGVAGALRTEVEWRGSPPAASVAAQPWISFGRKGTRHPVPPTGDGPMSGLRVLDLTRVLAGPTCTLLLALLGADVLRVDGPATPELLDQYLDTGSGKRSAVADLRDPLRLGVIHELLDEADVLATGYRPGALDAFSLDPASVRERHPHVVHVRLSAWGDDGPWGLHRGFDSIVQAVTGIGHRYGSTDSYGHFTPGALPVQALDLATGYAMAGAVMALLAARPEQGAGGAAFSLAATAHLLLEAGPAPAAGPHHELSIETTTTQTPHGLLTHVTGPATADGVPLVVRSPGPYGRASLGWQ